MRSFFWLAIGVMLAFAGAAQAQIRVVTSQTDVSNVHLLRNDSVQKELKLSLDQIQKLRSAFNNNQESMRDVWQTYPPEEAGKHWTELNADLRKDSLAILTAEQLARFRQIDFQNIRNSMFDSTTFQRADILKTLALTPEQKNELQAIGAETAKKNQDAIKPFNLYQQKLVAIRKEDRERAAAILTDEQKKAWDNFLGKPFVVQNLNPNTDIQTALRKWIRDDFGKAQTVSRDAGKPIFALFRCEP